MENLQQIKLAAKEKLNQFKDFTSNFKKAKQTEKALSEIAQIVEEYFEGEINLIENWIQPGTLEDDINQIWLEKVHLDAYLNKREKDRKVNKCIGVYDRGVYLFKFAVNKDYQKVTLCEVSFLHCITSPN